MNSTSILVPEDSGSLGPYRIENGDLCVSLAEEKGGVAAQWFYFQVVGLKGADKIRIRIENAHKSLYPRGWPNYLPVYSQDGVLWHRVAESSFVDGQLLFSIINPASTFFVAWYEPYPISRLVSWIENLKQSSGIKCFSPFDNFFLLSFGEPKLGSIVIIARQHPGETLASFFVEGLVDYLTSGDSDAKALRERFQILIFPVMNPTGVIEGRHRYDERGIDYNRAWQSEMTPSEVQFVKDALEKVEKLHFFFDIHGDEVTKKDPNYIDAESSKHIDKTRRTAQRQILRLISRFTKDFEVLGNSSIWATRIKKLIFPKLYPAEQLSEGITATEYVGHRYRVPAFTYEIKAHGTTSKSCYEMGKGLGQAFAEYRESLSGS